jgi:thiol-disulfide isomerase/thioredoxin
MKISKPWLRVCLTVLVLSILVVAVVVLAPAFYAFTHERPKLDPAVYKLQTEFWEKHPAFTAPLGTTFLTVEQWEQAAKQCSDAEEYSARFLALAKAHPGSSTAAEALSVIIAYFPEAPACKESVEIFSRDYPDRFPDQWRGLIQPAAPYGDHYFRAIVEKTPNRAMRGHAMLARSRFRQAVMHDNATAEKLLEQVVAQFADIKVSKDSSATLGELAKDDLANLRSTDTFEELRAGLKVPHFEATTIDGRAVQVPDSYKGKVLLLDFWATWCGPCVKEIPNVVDAYEKYHGRGLEVLSVSLDQQNGGAVLTSFTRKHNMQWPQIFDGKYLDTPIARRFCIKSIPCAVLIDGDTGLIVACGEDARGPKLAAAIEDALAKKRSATR